MLTDLDGDNKFDEMKTVVADFKGVHAIALHEGWMYLSNTRELKRYKLNSDGTVGEMQPLLNDLPDG